MANDSERGRRPSRRVIGAYEAGRPAGTWTWLHEDGSPARTVTYVDGLAEGDETSWHPDGAVHWRGRSERGVKVGSWTATHPNGAVETVHHYVLGKLHGEFHWDNDDKSPRVRGRYEAGTQVGAWTWWDWEGWGRIERVYDAQGRLHGVDRHYASDGKLALERTWVEDQLNGPFAEFHPDGSRKESGTYVAGAPHGTLHRWDLNGQESTLQYDHGVELGLLADAALLTRLGKSMAKKKDDWAMMEVLERAVETGQGRLLWHLVNEGYLDAGAKPQIWGKLADHAQHATARGVVALLERAQPYDAKDWRPQRLVDDWPAALDAIATRFYARDGTTLDAALKRFPPKVQKGLAIVKRKLGKGDGKGLPRNLAAQLAKKHIDDGGLTDAWMLRDGELVHADLADRVGDPTEAMRALLELLVGQDLWTQALIAQMIKTKNTRVSAVLAQDALRAASADDLATMLNKLEFGTSYSYGEVQRVFDAWRDDGGDFWLALAPKILEVGLKSLCAQAAIRRFTAEGRQLDPRIDELLHPDGIGGDPGFTWMREALNGLKDRSDPAAIDQATSLEDGEGSGWIGVRAMSAALRALPDGRGQAVVARWLDGDHVPEGTFAVLATWPSVELLDKALAAVRRQPPKTFYASHAPSGGLGLLHGVEALTHLVTAFDAETDPAIALVLKRGILYAMARTAASGQGWPEAFDRFVQVHDWPPDVRENEFEYHLQRPIWKVLFRTPQARAEKVVLRLLDGPGRTFGRAFSMISAVATDAVLARAFDRLLDLEPELNSDQNRWVEQGLNELMEEKTPWVRWCALNGAGGRLASVFSSAVGSDNWEQFEKERAEEGYTLPKRLDAIDECLAMAAALPGDRTRLYLLRWSDALPQGLNRIGGRPLGISADRWPRFDDEPMQFLFSLDLRTMPELGARLPGAIGLAVFVSATESNDATEPNTPESAVVAIVDDTTHEPPEGAVPVDPASFEPVPIDVPVGQSHGHQELRRKLYAVRARVLGSPGWIQEPEYDGEFIMQFDERFVPMNLGDTGRMYVFRDTAFWQCH